MDQDFSDIEAAVAAYYTDKLVQHGPSPGGVDWNSESSQELRYRQLLKICQSEQAFSLNAYGCGYGFVIDMLADRAVQVDYVGCDVSASMIEVARQAHSNRKNCRFEIGARPSRDADYTIASGIFGVKLTFSNERWRAFMLSVLDSIDKSSAKGFAFNCLTKYSDPHLMREDLYYADPCWIFDHCKSKYARNVALLHDYGLYEFTILVRKDH